MKDIDTEAGKNALGEIDPLQVYQFGAIPTGDGRTRFRLWAPGVYQVYLELDGRVSVPMRSCADGFHELVYETGPGTRYCYRVGAGMHVPDPASRLQDGDVHDLSVVVDPNSYSWQHPDWRGRPWHESVIQEVHVGLAGGFRGLQESLAELCDMGITAIELMPIADFPGTRNWGYDGVLPYAPDGAYGSPDELRQLIDTAHGMNMQVFLDVVYNHFGPEGNYLSAFVPEFFRDDIPTPWGQALDFRKAQVRRFFAENALYWLREYRFDGLRLDAVHAISEQNWLPEMARFVRACLPAQRYIHLILENDDNASHLMRCGFNAQWNDDMHHVLHHLLTGESSGYYSEYAENPAEGLARCLREGFIFQGEVSTYREGRPRGEPSGRLPPTAFVSFLQNHDQIGNRAFGERLTSLCAGRPERLRAAIALQLLCPHIPMIFMGEEYGARQPFLYFTSFPDPDLARAVRDGRRREFAGFEQFGGEHAEIPDPNSEDTWRESVLRDKEDGDAREWRKLYRDLLAIRKEHITPWLDTAKSETAVALGKAGAMGSWTLGRGRRLTLYCNLSDEAVDIPKPPAEAMLLYPTEAMATPAWRTGKLPPNCTIATVTTIAAGSPESAA